MLVSGREATRILRPVVGGDAQARLLLATGLVGAAVRTGAATLYEESRVRALVDRPPVSDDDLLACDLPGAYVARLPRSTGLRVTDPWPEAVAAVSAVPTTTTWTVALLGVQIAAWGRLPWVATVSGFVALCADLVGFDSERDRTSRFVLEHPGPWCRVVEGRRWPTSPGGRPWHLWHPLPASVAPAPGTAERLIEVLRP